MKVSLRSLLLFIVGALIAMVSSNALLSFLAMAVLGLGFFLLWRPNVSPILIFVLGYQWLQASTKIFHANLLGVDVDELSQFGGQLSRGILLSLIGLLFFAYGMRWGAGPARVSDGNVLRKSAQEKSQLFWLKLYVAALLIATIAQVGARLVPGLSQPLIALAGLKWAFYWIFTYVTFFRTDGLRALWFIVFFFELLLSFGGYFSEFRTILFMTILALIPAGVRINFSRIVGLLSISILTIVIALVWTAIKTDYRNYLSQGERAQVVYVSYTDSLKYAATLISDLDGVAFQKAATSLANRVSYVDFFSRSIDFVPAFVPYENGAIWWDAVTRPFMPRIFFPSKTAINDSDRTNQFTGVSVATADEGTSISIGYMGEAYIDFGPSFMMIPIFALGLWLGGFYKWISNYPTVRGLMGMGFATATLYQAAQFETSITKLIGGLVVAMLVSWIVARMVVPRLYHLTRRAMPAVGRR